MSPVKNLCTMTSYGGIIRIRLQGRSSITSSQPVQTSSPAFHNTYIIHHFDFFASYFIFLNAIPFFQRIRPVFQICLPVIYPVLRILCYSNMLRSFDICQSHCMGMYHFVNHKLVPCLMLPSAPCLNHTIYCLCTIPVSIDPHLCICRIASIVLRPNFSLMYFSQVSLAKGMAFPQFSILHCAPP